MATILSPHCDDAVLGLGQFMQTEPCLVITVFAGFPDESLLTDYDKSCGFESSGLAMATRCVEDVRALQVVGAKGVHLGRFDLQYRDGTSDDDGLADELRVHLTADTFVPLGIGHPDHVAVARAVRAAVPVGMPLFWYEEAPYRTLHPEQAHISLVQMKSEGFAIQDLPFPLSQGSLDVKAKAIARYKSQFPNGADDPCLLVPERVWRAVKTA